MKELKENLAAIYGLAKTKCAGIVEAIRFERYRRQMMKHNVKIHPRARIHGIWTISIGADTQIHDYATVTTTNPTDGWNDRLHSKKFGSIAIGERCRILPGAFVSSCMGHIEIGNDVSINPNCVLYGHGGLTIGDNTRIATNTVIIPANHNFDDPHVPIKDQGLTLKGISIGQDVWIGAGCRIIDGVSIGDGAVVGAGAVVMHDIPPFSVANGMPARPQLSRGADMYADWEDDVDFE